MATVSVKCPNCGGALELDDSKEFGFCVYCGTQVRIQDEKTRVEVSGSVTFDESDKYKNFLNLATQAYTAGNMEEAYNYYTRALEIKQSDYIPVFRKALCAGYLSTDSGLRIEEIVSGVSRAFDMASDDSAKTAMSEDILTFVVNEKPRLNTEFYSSDDCAHYVKSIYNRITLLNRLYPFVNKENMDGAVQFINTEQSYCALLTKRVMQFKAGTTVKNGKAQTVFGTYPVPQNILSDVADINRRFSEEFNQFIRPEIARLESSIAETKEKIKELPGILRTCHTLCDFRLIILALLLCICFIGIPILIAQVVLLIVGKMKDTDSTAKNLYKSLNAQKKELAALKRKLR